MASFLLNLSSLIPISISIILLAVAAFIWLWYRHLHRRRILANDVEKGSSVNAKVSDNPATKFTWEEIREMTSNFSSEVIAHGGYSSVYLSNTVPSSAVKVHNGSNRLHATFLAELDILLHLRHPNIVKIVGFSDHDNQGALVFEYVPNGTLHESLHGEAPSLSWSRRMRIALQLAMALEFLHENCDLQIVHNDVKPSNILLDEELNCKLCDFGSSKLGFSSTVDRKERRHILMGTVGYVDPYYLRTGVVSRGSDVYSYGVVVLEMVTGREAFCGETGKALVKVMQPMLREVAEGKMVVEIVDGRLEGRFDGGEMVAMANVVERCVEEEPSRRPSMGEVVRMLKEMLGRSIVAVECISNDGGRCN